MSRSFASLVPYVLRHRRRFACGFGFLALTTAFQLAAPWVLKMAIDDLRDEITREGLGRYALILVGMAAAGGVCRFMMRRLIVGASREIEYDIRNTFFAHLQRLSLTYFQRHRTGDLMSRATNDLNAVRMMVGPAIMYASTTAIVFTVAVALMMSISPWLTVVVLLPLPIVSILVRTFGSAIHRRSEQIQAQLAKLSAVTQESLAGVRVVRAYGIEAGETARFREANDIYVERNRRVIQLQGVFYPSLALFLGVSAMAMLWVGGRQVIQGRISMGDFVAFNAYLAMLSWPMIAFGAVTNMLQRGLSAWERMQAVMHAMPEIADSDAARGRLVSSPLSGRIEFRHLTFSYGGGAVIHDVSATVEAGHTLALIGQTGAGKSTIANLLVRLFDPPPGSVFIDGVDVREIPLSTLRGAIASVPQEPFLFSDTVARNVAFGAAGDPGSEAVRRALAVARLDKDLASFPQGPDTLVGERGVTLSGGQKQRVAIARAVVADPTILILDDATSSVDTQTEAEILDRLRDVMRTRTSIIISHRVSAVRGADLILVLEDGRVVERGKHDALVAANGVYARLHRQQALERKLAES